MHCWVAYCYAHCVVLVVWYACHCLVAYFVASDAMPPVSSGWCTVIFVCWWWWLRCLHVHKYVSLCYALTNVQPWRWREIPVWNKSIFVFWRLLFAHITAVQQCSLGIYCIFCCCCYWFYMGIHLETVLLGSERLCASFVNIFVELIEGKRDHRLSAI